MAKPRAKTGERRIVRQPLVIDRLPPDIHEAIKFLRSRCGLTWLEIERISALKFNKRWASEIGKHGFLDWDSLPTDVLEKFPQLRLPHTTLHRWYDLRIEQVKAEVMKSAEQARSVAEAFADAGMVNSDEAVMNAARDVIFGMLNAQDEKSRAFAAKGLLALAEVMQEARKNDIKERSVAVDESKLKVLEAREALTRRRLEAETERAAKKVSNGQFTLDDINLIRERTFGLPPLKPGEAA